VEGFGVSAMNISGRLSAIPKQEKDISHVDRKSSVAPKSRSQHHNKNDDELPDDGIKS
jgi:hypothetical protein